MRASIPVTEEDIEEWIATAPSSNSTGLTFLQSLCIPRQRKLGWRDIHCNGLKGFKTCQMMITSGSFYWMQRGGNDDSGAVNLTPVSLLLILLGASLAYKAY